MAISEIDVKLSTACNQTTGEPEWPVSAEEVAALKQEVYNHVFQTDVGKRFLETYVFDERTTVRVQSEFARRFGQTGTIGGAWPGVPLTARLLEVLEDLLLIKDSSLTLEAPEEPESAPAERPRDTRGQFISDIQAEVESDIASGTVSTVEIRQKRTQSREYDAAFLKATSLQEARRPKPSTISQEVQDFANAYNTSSASGMRFINGAVTLGGQRYTQEQLDMMLEKAANARLIR